MSPPPAPAPERRRRVRPLDVLCLGGLGLGILTGVVVTFAAAYLLRHPVLHLATGAMSGLVAGGARARVGELPLALVVSLGLLGLVLFDGFYYWTGRRFRNRIRSDLVTLLSLPPRRLEQAERLVGRWGVWLLVVEYFLPVPNFVLMMLVGAARVPLWKFVLADLVGTSIWLSLLVGAGYWAGEGAVSVVDAVTEQALVVTLVLTVVLTWVNVRRARAQERSGP